ncbi:hypothetical protein QYZ96_06270 [Escherichia coli]|nr:hypothetical protein [Escherichia coli]MDN4878497.1 hypothetical protein [Escherichia coli]
MGAISAVMVGLLNSGDHILLVNQIVSVNGAPY